MMNIELEIPTTESIDDHLTEDVLVEILVRLPLKSAFLCKCVSKRWFSLISNPNFVRCFLNHCIPINYCLSMPMPLPPPSSNFLVVQRPRDNGVRMQFMFKSPAFDSLTLVRTCYETENKERRLICGHCCVLETFNDLVLCCEGWYEQSVYYICNPLTRQWVVLPPVRPRNYDDVALSFKCDPFFKREEEYGFFKEGVVTLNPEYRFRVVRAVPLKSDLDCTGAAAATTTPHVMLEIFSSDTGRWDETVMACSEEFLEMPWSLKVVASDRMLLYARRRRFPECIMFSPYDIIGTTGTGTGDCRHSVSSGVHLKVDPRMGFLEPTMVDHGRRLLFPELLVQLPYRAYRNVWELEDLGGGGKWRLVHNVRFTKSLQDHFGPSRIFYAKFIGFHPDDVNIMYFLYSNGLHIALCNMQNRTLNLVDSIQHNRVCVTRRCLRIFPLVLPQWPTPVPKLPAEEKDMSSLFTY